MTEFFDSLDSITSFIFTIVFAVFGIAIALFIIAMVISAIFSLFPRSRRKVDQENEELRKQHDEDCKKLEKMEQYKTEGERLYNATLEKLQATFSEDIPKMLDRVIAGRLNNAFDSNLSIENFTTQFPSSDATQTYTTTLTSCTCPDYKGVPPHTKKNPLPCKHMLYLAYTLGVLQLNQTETQAKYWVSVQRINEKAKERKELETEIKKLKRRITSLNQTIEKKKAAAKNESLKP